MLLLSNSGMALSVHYCGGEIASVSSIYSIDESCKMPVKEVEKPHCAEDKENHSKCCDDEIISLQDKSDTVIVKIFSFNVDSFFFFEEWEPLVFLTDIVTILSQFSAYYCDANAPPLFKLHCQYTLYA